MVQLTNGNGKVKIEDRTHLGTPKRTHSLDAQHGLLLGCLSLLLLLLLFSCPSGGAILVWEQRWVAYEGQLGARGVEFGEGISEPG